MIETIGKLLGHVHTLTPIGKLGRVSRILLAFVASACAGFYLARQ